MVAAVIAISSQEEADAIAMGFPPTTVHRVPHGVCTDLPQAAARLATRPTNVLGVATRLVPGKGLRDILQAAARIPETQVVIAGDGPLLQPLHRTVADLGISGRVQFLGWQERLDVFYASITLFISMSRKEGLPYSVLDAMARGVPVIASDIPGHRDLIVNGETGFLVDAGPALVTRVKQLLRDAPLRAQIALASTARVRAHFAICDMLRRQRSVEVATWQALRS
jgi:glycosyltransferase involved in cell wall biosynthesis